MSWFINKTCPQIRMGFLRFTLGNHSPLNFILLSEWAAPLSWSIRNSAQGVIFNYSLFRWCSGGHAERLLIDFEELKK